MEEWDTEETHREGPLSSQWIRSHVVTKFPLLMFKQEGNSSPMFRIQSS